MIGRYWNVPVSAPASAAAIWKKRWNAAPAPPGLREKRCSLPDHRDQEPLRAEHLREAINEARWLLSNAKPMYLHCLAGQERSALLAVALVKEQRNLSLLDALLWVRQRHPPASPLYRHLELLETLSQENN